tara:strand:+ start:535 stop:921 length:387 start_codon:yes stop_codon:yes gene_type:complete
MNKLIIDVTNKDIFLMIIADKQNYSISHENSKINYEKLIVLINNFLIKNRLKINDISTIYINNGSGSFAGIRNSLAVVKAIHLVEKIDYYCYNFEIFKGENNVKYENIPQLCNKFKVKKNLINPAYIS